MDDGIPEDVMDLKIYDMTNTSDEIIGTWSNGIWYDDVAASKWTKMTASNPTGEIAAVTIRQISLLYGTMACGIRMRLLWIHVPETPSNLE
ncbi:MAG: hypothetical protein PVI42_03440 [Desulfobacterales bacterium]|jgi:hypothetical protein